MRAAPRGRGDHRFCVAPMMDCTDRHCRVFHRLLSRHARLYTEMLTTGAVLHGDRQRLLGFSEREHPVALQLGGSDPDAMAAAAAIGEAFGYDEININAGCPSDRVQAGRFGACLMAEPERVAACIAAMRRACRVPVTVKCRIGIDDRDAYEDLRTFVDAVAGAGAETVIVHARKAWLRGLSPKANRTVPPLHYERVYRLKADFPDLTIVINGGITDLDQAAAHLAHVDGVMLGRAAYHDPMLLAGVDRRLFGAAMGRPEPERDALVEALAVYLESEAAADPSGRALLRHVQGLYQGVPGARAWRRSLTGPAPAPA
ncbi:MAG: tRNA dihydrouridine(20/20a) synthase DusA, partial [Alphaproteobacteria bacterium]|nr:tRNA dihydrouridine(20/20a) synthase DusA [Alphaproteobacteria bacterium]